MNKNTAEAVGFIVWSLMATMLGYYMGSEHRDTWWIEQSAPYCEENKAVVRGMEIKAKRCWKVIELKEEIVGNRK